MTKDQELLFKELRKIQEEAVEITLLKMDKYINTEALLRDATYEAIYSIMELLDGYYNNNLKGEIIDVQSGESISSEIELHDHCEDYLVYADI